jgi:hypothetical protein
MQALPEDDIITNSDESRRLPDENPEPLEGVKQEESNLIEEKPEVEKKEGKQDLKKKQEPDELK